MLKSGKTFFGFAVSLALLCWSCEIAALGPRLDLEAPRLSLTRPAFAETVPEEFELAGTVTDNVKTTLLTVHIEGLSREWRNNLGTWQTRQTPEAPWQPCLGLWKADGNTVSWSLPVSLAGIRAGGYMITINSFDEPGNNDDKSIQQVKITYINEKPFFTVLAPALKTGTANRVPKALEDMNDATRLNPAFIGELYNESVSLRFEISGGDFSRGGSLTLYLAGPPSGPDLDNTDLIPGDIWYEKTIPVSNRTGSITILHNEIQNSALIPASGRTPLRLISRITDSQMREEYKSSGWFMWWPESNKPWVLFPADSDPAAASYTKLYEGGENTAYAYDDDGVASLVCRIYKWDRAGGKTVGTPVTEQTISFGENQNEWSFTLPGTPGDYCIEALVTDKNGTTETARAWVTATKRPLIQYKYLIRISSSNADGIYLTGDSITIRLDFDVPIIVEGKPKLRLNIENKNSVTRYADFSSGAPGKTLYFTYIVQDGDFSPGTDPRNVVPLDVTGIDTSGGHFSFRDPYEVVGIDNELKLPVDAESRLAGQKKIYVVYGKPRVSSVSVPRIENGKLTVEFEWPENPFSWTLVRGSTNENLKLAIKESEYRIPAVITEARYKSLGLENGGEGYKDKDNNPYYERTINGARDNGSRTDTDPKYVLRFDLDTADFGDPASAVNDRNLLDVLRKAETIYLSAHASQISLSNRGMTVNLDGLLPVKGVDYELSIPQGFFKDSLEGVDIDAVTKEVFCPGVEQPFFRVEKNDEVYDTFKKQAKQPATARVRLDCRTPGAEIYYTDPDDSQSFISDPVGPYLLKQEKVGAFWYLVPQPQPAKIDVKNSPDKVDSPPLWRYSDPGKLPAPHNPGKTDPAKRSKKYDGIFTIGNDNYALGGMVYRLGAVAYPHPSRPDTKDPSETTYEIAYRSVLVFNNTEAPPRFEYTTSLDGAGSFKFPSPYSDGENVRVWLMGGDSVSGAVITPGFPLSWKANNYDKIRLMTPVGTSLISGGGANQYTSIGGHTANNALNYNNNVPASYNADGRYVWYWITWKLGNAAYVQFQRRAIGNLSNPATPLFDVRYTSDLKQGWNDYKEYYPVFPGETRVVNPVTPYWYRDGTSYQYYRLLGNRDSSTRWHPIEQAP